MSLAVAKTILFIFFLFARFRLAKVFVTGGESKSFPRRGGNENQHLSSTLFGQ
jgi:hypothetical protein